MTAQQIPMSFEELMQSFQEVRNLMRENEEKTEKRHKAWEEKMHKEAEERNKAWEEQHQKFDKEMVKLQKAQQETNKQIGALGGRLGDFIAEMVRGGIVEQFNALGYAVGSSTQKYVFRDEKTRQHVAEADLILLNGDTAVIVEAKLKAELKDVYDMLERMDTISASNDRLTKGSKLIGAIAAGVIDDSIANFAMKNGLYVITQTGDDMKIMKTPRGFKAKVW